MYIRMNLNASKMGKEMHVAFYFLISHLFIYIYSFTFHVCTYRLLFVHLCFRKNKNSAACHRNGTGFEQFFSKWNSIMGYLNVSTTACKEIRWIVNCWKYPWVKACKLDPYSTIYRYIPSNFVQTGKVNRVKWAGKNGMPTFLSYQFSSISFQQQ